jgi:VanZ family protein
VSIYILAVLPQDEVPALTPFSDKGNHFIAFAVLTLLLSRAYDIRAFSVFVRLLSYGIFIEFSQLFTLNRNSEALDVLADAVGILIGLALFYALKRYCPRCSL